MGRRPTPEPGPGPPSEAQRLVAKAGVTVYEGGTTIFDEPVLVYLGMAWRSPMEFKIYDHVGRPRGYAKHKVSHRHVAGSSWQEHGPCQIHDTHGSPLLQIRKGKTSNHVCRVEGVASATFGLQAGGAEISIMSGGEPLGYVEGKGTRSVRGPELRVFDHRHRRIAAVKAVGEPAGPSGSVTSYVVSIDPNFSGELRRLVLCLPPVVAGLL